ncbi:hypothetical protein FGO68_gene2261 [Halteria grandinella]|uniref:Uncharacterized protein n=1 Tax=Halteria grandinella TaxID=5974 RepID=A0A8J8NIF9_HALGN|nr:hypothetical protein FGO68_gene2261 [Halteria grandinella]
MSKCLKSMCKKNQAGATENRLLEAALMEAFKSESFRYIMRPFTPQLILNECAAGLKGQGKCSQYISLIFPQGQEMFSSINGLIKQLRWSSTKALKPKMSLWHFTF